MPADHLGRGGAGPRGLDLRHQRQPQPGHHQAGGQPGRGSGRAPPAQAGWRRRAARRGGHSPACVQVHTRASNEGLRRFQIHGEGPSLIVNSHLRHY